MPKLDNAKQELFCRFLARGLTQVEAYERAGYVRNKGNASILAAKPDVMLRVEELINDREARTRIEAEERNEKLKSAETTEDLGLNRNWILAELMDNALKAKEMGQFAAANSALKLLGEELGMFTTGQKRQVLLEAKKQIPSIDPINITHMLEQLGSDSEEESKEEEEQNDSSV